MLKLGLVGVGEIARKQHLPVIAAHPDVTLVAAASHAGGAPGVPNFRDVGAMIDAVPEVEAVVLCVPPAARYAAAREAIARRRHVFLEKPPGTSVAEVRDLAQQAAAAGVTLFASWHSRYAPAVEEVRRRLGETTLRRVHVPWKEDARVYHPGQEWIWQPGGFGVFDPGINAFSVLTHVLPRPFRLVRSVLSYPENRGQPVLAELEYVDDDGVAISCDWSFDHPDPQYCEMVFETAAGTLVMGRLGETLTVDGRTVVDEPEREYATLYDIFVRLVRERASDVDLRPLVHCADAFMASERRTIGRWDW